jgi:hypothetical protein
MATIDGLTTTLLDRLDELQRNAAFGFIKELHA